MKYKGGKPLISNVKLRKWSFSNESRCTNTGNSNYDVYIITGRRFYDCYYGLCRNVLSYHMELSISI